MDLSYAEENLCRARLMARSYPPDKPYGESGETLSSIIAGYEQWVETAKQAVQQAEKLSTPNLELPSRGA